MMDRRPYPPIIEPKRCAHESLFAYMWDEAGAEVDAEEAMMAERTAPLEARIAELEAALGVFIADREESGCYNCPFSAYDASGSFWCWKEDRKEPQPCKVGWREWVIEEGKKKVRDAGGE